MKGGGHEILLIIALILFLARLFGSIFSRFGVPSVIGEIVAGLVLGPSLLGIVEPNEVLKLLSEIGIILLLFHIGLEVDFDILKKTGIQAFIVAVIGAFLPVILGYGVGRYFMGLSDVASLFVGGTLAATSIGITVRILQEMGKMKYRASQIILAAAIVDDILGVLLLTMLYEFAQNGTFQAFSAARYSMYVFTFLIAAPFVAYVAAMAMDFVVKRYGDHRVIAPFLLSLMFFLAYAAEKVGAPEILGAFTGGLAFSRRFRIPFVRNFRVSSLTLDRIEGIIEPLMLVFTPMFFVYVGLEINLREIDFTWNLFWIFLLLSLVAFVSKGIAGIFVKGSMAERFFIGLAMIPRGEVGLIFVELGRMSGIFDASLYAVMIGVVVFTTFIAPFMMRFYINRTGLFAD